jgi:hypothetical protein
MGAVDQFCVSGVSQSCPKVIELPETSAILEAAKFDPASQRPSRESAFAMHHRACDRDGAEPASRSYLCIL